MSAISVLVIPDHGHSGVQDLSDAERVVLVFAASGRSLAPADEFCRQQEVMR